jgi:hypothetical protein
MNSFFSRGKLAFRTWRYYWRTELGHVLAVAACVAVMAGALAVGDSVRETLRVLATQRLGKITLAVVGGERFMAQAVTNAIAGRRKNMLTAPLIMIPGTVIHDASSRRVNGITLLGVEATFGALAAESGFPLPAPGEVVLNGALARRLGVGVGEEVFIRVARPGLVKELALETGAGATLGFRGRVHAVTSDGAGGRFSLENSQAAPLNLYVPLEDLQERLDLSNRVNLVVAGAGAPDTGEVGQRLRTAWSLDDAGLEVRAVPVRGGVELRSRSVFLAPWVARAVVAAEPAATAVSTYLVNGIRSGPRTTPYSFVAGVKAVGDRRLACDEIVLTDWLAEDLAVTRGAVVELSYWALGPLRSFALTSSLFRVAAVLPLSAVGDPSLMPAIPGLSEAGDCRDWEAGVPIELGRIRPKDEDYWNAWRGAPKAFIALEAAERAWSNRWGALTAIRIGGVEAGHDVAAVRRRLTELLLPEAPLPEIRDVAAEAARARDQAMDLGQLFLGLSVFLIVSTVLLMALSFGVAEERRLDHAGILLALGFQRRDVNRSRRAELLRVVAVGGVLGLAGGLLYARGLLTLLARGWPNAAAPALVWSPDWGSLAVGGVLACLLALGAQGWVLRRYRRWPVRALLEGAPAAREETAFPGMACSPRTQGAKTPGVGAVRAVGLAGVVGAVLAAWAAHDAAPGARVGLFFAVGACLLTAGIAAGRGSLAGWGRAAALAKTRRAVAWREAGRHPGRSVLVSAMTACAVFLLLVVAIFEPREADPEARGSGAGGFGLWVQSALPLLADLNTESGRKAYGLDRSGMEGVRVVGLRVRPGDDAGCGNLNRAQQPVLAGVEPAALAGRGAFTFAQTLYPQGWKPAGPPGWDVLDAEYGADVVPGVTDETTLMWGLGKRVGDTLSYVDERGRPFQVKFVGVLASSVLQGQVLIPERAFTDRFPSLTGYRQLLVEAPRERRGAVADALRRALRDEGAEVVATEERLGELNAVTGLYIRLFQTLGGIGLLLGVAGVGFIVIRNALERRGELALLRATGFTRRGVVALLVTEQAWVLGWGLLVGVGSAALAVWPVRAGAGMTADLWAGPLLRVAAMAITGLLAAAIGAWHATRGEAVEGLRGE